MKKNIVILSLLVVGLFATAQDTKKLFGSLTLSFYGIDFTKAQLVGFGDESPHQIRDDYFKAWNNLVLDLDLMKVFQKNAVYKDPNGVTKLNTARETETIKTKDETELTPDVIAEVVKKMPVGQKKEG